jgi:hypothetical protein
MNTPQSLTPIRDTDGTPLDVALDVDGVIADFARAFIGKAKEMGLDFFDHPTEWRRRHLDGDLQDAFSKPWPDIRGNESFWLERVQPIPKAFVDFPVACYVTARSQAPNGATQKWIFRHGFPAARVYRVDKSEEKLPVLRQENVDIFVEDKISTVKMLQEEWGPENDVPYPVLITTAQNSPRSKDDASEVWTRIDYLTELKEITIPNQAQTYVR